jgi:bacteriorhodopsin
MQTLIYFGLSGAAMLYALSLLWQKYVTKSRRAQRDRGAFTMFAIFMMVVSASAFALGILTG